MFITEKCLNHISCSKILIRYLFDYLKIKEYTVVDGELFIIVGRELAAAFLIICTLWSNDTVGVRNESERKHNVLDEQGG